MSPVATCCARGLMLAGLGSTWRPMSLGANRRAAAGRRSRAAFSSWSNCPARNDGLNTVVPYGDDAYYRARPRIGIRADKLRKLDDHFGFQSPWPASSGSTRTASWRSCTASATTSPRSPISPPWRIGRRPRRTAARLWLARPHRRRHGSARARQLSGQHRHPAVARGARARPRAAGVRRSAQIRAHAAFAERELRYAAVAARGTGGNERRDSCSSVAQQRAECRAARAATPGRSIARRSTTAWCASGSSGSRR